MKKLFFLSVMLLGIIFSSSAGENKQLERISDSYQIYSENILFGCTAGITTCGEPFMVCDQGGSDFTPQEAWIVYSNENLSLCGEMP